MLNSLLDQKPNIIKIDRLIYDDEHGVKTFTTDPEQIEQRTIDHYKNISKSKKLIDLMIKISHYDNLGKIFTNR